MTNEDIRKLLGGYATNTLTESERKALFEAALADQKLFDALQAEEALKDLLRDLDARREIRAALDQRRAAWWSRRWVWAGALAAVGILTMVMIRPFERTRQIQIASNQITAAHQIASSNEAAGKIAPAEQAQPAPALAAPVTPPAPRRSGTRATGSAMNARARPSAASPVPAPPPPAAPAPAAGVAAQEAAPIAPRAMVARKAAASLGTVSGAADSLASPSFHYSLVRRDANGVDTPVSGADLKAGDVVRIRVSAPESGNLTLFQRDASGALRQVFPAAPATANSDVTPDWPIVVQNNMQNFKLTLAPAEAKKAAPPLSVDIPIGPGN